MGIESYWQVLLSLVVTLVLAVISLLVIKKLRVGLIPQSKALKVVDSTRLDQRSSLFLVDVEGTRYLVGTQQSGGSVAITRLDRPEQTV